MGQPKLIIIGGANGSGKTTLAREFVLVDKIDYLGADEIARELNPKNPEDEAISAARIFSYRLDDYLANRKSVLVESTLSGLSLRKHLAAARIQNFEITILFVYLDTPELCIERVAARVAKGGHHVPDEDIRRRFKRANINFWKVYKIWRTSGICFIIQVE
jgi:predicted ABC-type ATPase